METTEFDATLGGPEHLPKTVNSLKFAASRSIEIAAMTESILNPSKVRLVFQSLPVHMRRRVMSHNSKRLPIKLRKAHLDQLKKSGLPPKQKKPSRKHRRRPQNLLKEYNRRKQNNTWLETHIWHAKRFHMTNRWGYRLAEAPCDKVFRACYRATSKHCLLQDVSYLVPIQIKGDYNIIRDMFSMITTSNVCPTIDAKAYTTGTRQGEIHIFDTNSYPHGYIGKATFLWEPLNEIGTNGTRTLWLFVHPSQHKQLEKSFNSILSTVKDCDNNAKRQKINNIFSENIKIKSMAGALNYFRLTGPNSHSILVKSLNCIEDITNLKSTWITKHTKINPELYLKDKEAYWKSISHAQSPAQLSPRIIVSLIVRDPRLMRPSYRTKATSDDSYTQLSRATLTKISPTVSYSPLWAPDIHKELKQKVKTNGQFIEHVTKLNLVPGEIYENDPELQIVPVVLIQRPGSQEASYKKLGYGCGWDLIVPSGYGLPFWQTFIMFGARAGGLRETESLALEMGESFLPPDSNAGKENAERVESELRDKYFKLPPKKRENYIKLGINCPFSFPWKLLLQDWSNKPVDDFYVLRDWKSINNLQECVKKKSVNNLEIINKTESCLVAVYIKLADGNLQRNAVICMPRPGDTTVKNLLEPPHEDANQLLRKETRAKHVKNLKRLRRLRVKQKKKLGTTITSKMKKPSPKLNVQPSAYMKLMRELWLPSKIDTVRQLCTRETMGFVAQGAFSFTEAQSCGIAYIAYNALHALIKSSQGQVLVRNPSSNKYYFAKIELIKYV